MRAMTTNHENQQMSTLSTPRLVIGAPQGRSGKTTFTLGLLRALSRQGLPVQPYKKGPDYIDTSWHTAAAGRVSRNLDSFMMSQEDICRSLAQHSQDCQFSLIEGAMGLFDGLDINGSASTAEIAKITSSPVLLVLDATRITRSLGAIVMGCQHFDPNINIVGVVLNKIARARHEKLARETIEQYCRIPVVGAIPKDSRILIPDRHLGLVTNGEWSETDTFLDNLADVVSENVDIAKIMELARTAAPLSYSTPTKFSVSQGYPLKTKPPAPRIGVIRDAAFSFYYPENLAVLESKGAELVTISALAHQHLPKDLDALYIGGGFPEVFAEQLANNRTLRQEIRLAGEDGLPIYAECGGLMFLGRSIITGDGSYDMVGLLPLDTRMEKKPQGHGYTVMKVLENNPWFRQPKIRGHEFHNSSVLNLDRTKIEFGFEVERGHGIDGKYEGICYKGVMAAYNHIHALGSPDWAECMVKLATQYKERRSKMVFELFKSS
ncbi:cobyrinic acid a,c-diamide synthase [Desulfitobacterium hafniense DP7]|uniref:Cobyrinate a,c-diamide synthase n=2 Tax=Desulfitobacteriaceae TaxID=2937909 RepID=G9XKH5_DESHA|nr:cobyrinic acid a,c-diamide synthase [Desulfitobacterium hafniense DP7]